MKHFFKYIFTMQFFMIVSATTYAMQHPQIPELACYLDKNKTHLYINLLDEEDAIKNNQKTLLHKINHCVSSFKDNLTAITIMFPYELMNKDQESCINLTKKADITDNHTTREFILLFITLEEFNKNYKKERKLSQHKRVSFNLPEDTVNIDEKDTNQLGYLDALVRLFYVTKPKT